jgi:ATP-binding cassette, subfamily B (MDR/TAP), member 1
VVGCTLGFIEGLTFPAIGFFISRIVASLLKIDLDPQFYEDQVYMYVYIMLGISFSGAISNSICHLVFAVLGEKAIRTIRVEAFDKILKMPMVWFDREENQKEKVMNRLTSSCKTLYQFVELYIPNLYLIVINVLAAIVAALFFEWRTGLTSLGLIPLIIVAQAVQLGFIQGFSEFKGKIFNDSSLMINETVMNIRTVLMLGRDEVFVGRYGDSLSDIFTVLIRKSILSGFMLGVAYFLQFLTFALIFFLASVYTVSNGLDIENSLSSIFLILFASISAGNKTNLMSDLATIREALNNAFYFLDLEDEKEIQQKTGSKQLTVPIRGNIEFRDVAFKYEGRESATFEHLNLKIREG